MALEHQTEDDDENGGRGCARNEEKGCSCHGRSCGCICSSCSMGRELDLWYDHELHMIVYAS